MADEGYMQLAIEQAVEAKAAGEWPIGAVIVRNDEIIARNQCREARIKSVLGHAELLAVSDACKVMGSTDLRDCTLYTTNEPCLMCSAAIMQGKISRVVIATSRHDLPHLLRPRKNRIEHLAEDSGYNPEIVHGISKKAALDLFAVFRRA